MEKAEKLASSLKTFEIKLTHADHLDEYFRCVFLRAEGSGLLDANARYRSIFGRESDSPFMPHLSLMYGNFPPVVREKAVHEIGRLDESFLVRNVHFYRIGSGNPKDWVKVREFPFHSV